MNVHLLVSKTSLIFVLVSTQIIVFFLVEDRPQCFSLTDFAHSPNGTLIRIDDLREGTQVLAMDSNDRIVPTEIISILHYEKTDEGLTIISFLLEFQFFSFLSSFLYVHYG